MKYIYSKEMCSACDKLKSDLREKGIKFFERDGDRLAMDSRIMDAIDREAFIQLQCQNLTFPVEIDVEGFEDREC